MAILGVPRERLAISSAASSSISVGEDPRRAPDDRAELARLVVAEPERHPEAVAQRRRQQARARGGADERERRQVDRQGARGGALPEDDVEPEVLERRIEDLLGGAVEPVDLVDEEDVARLDRGQDRRDVLLLERRAGDGAEADAELLAHDLRQRRLAEARRPGEQHVVERLAAALGGVERDPELLLDPLLTDEVVEPARPQGPLDLLVLGVQHGCDDASLTPAQRRRESADAARGLAPPHARARALTPRGAPAARARPAAAPGRRPRGAARPRAPSSRARRERRARRGASASPRPGTTAGSSRGERDLVLQLEHDALGRLPADPGDGLNRA